MHSRNNPAQSKASAAEIASTAEPISTARFSQPGITISSATIRRGMLLLLIFCLIAALTACAPTDGNNSAETTAAEAGQSETNNGESQDDSTEAVNGDDLADTTEAASGAAAFTAEDLEVVYDGKSYKLLEDASGLLAALGDNYDYSEADSCVFDGMDKSFDYGDVFVYTVPAGDTDLLDGYDIFAGDQKTSAGIALGASRDSVIAVYGEPADDADYMVYNESGDPESIEEPRLTFAIGDDGTVEMISYYSGSNAQG